MTRSLRITRKPVPLRMQVVARLRAAICEQWLAPGTRLVERGLCEMLGVSRTLVREALRQLEAEGMVTIVPHRGPSVAILDLPTVKGIYEVRAVLEALAGRLFVERAGDEDRQRLRAAFGLMTQAHARNDIPAGLRGTAQFYEVLFAGAGNEVIAATLRPLSGRIYLLRARSMSFPGRRAEALQEMHEIMDAALGENPLLAWDRCHMHVQNACRYALHILEQETKAPDRKPSRRARATSRRRPTDASLITAARPPR